MADLDPDTAPYRIVADPSALYLVPEYGDMALRIPLREYAGLERDLVVIGGGTAGSWAAKTGVGLGARTALIEQDGFGGTCTATG